jgi:hypothetical protein
MELVLMEQRDKAREEVERLTIERDNASQEVEQLKWNYEQLSQKASARIKFLEEDHEKARAMFDQLTKERDEARAKVERLTRELEQAVAERTPHDYGILRDQRDAYRDRLCASIKETQEARAEVEQLKQALHDARLENSGQAALIEELQKQSAKNITVSWSGFSSGGGGGGKSTYPHGMKVVRPCERDDHMPDATKMIRPEPSRLEIAAMVIAARSHSTFFQEPKSEAAAALIAADALIKAAKGGAE